MIDLTESERHEFEARKYDMMEVMLLDNGDLIVCYPGRVIAAKFILTDDELAETLRTWQSRPTEYKPPSARAVDFVIDDDDEFTLKI